MVSEKDVNKIFKPSPINGEGKPIKGYSIYVEGELPKFLTKKQELPKYEIIRPDGSVLAVVPTTFRNDIREEFVKLGYIFTSVTDDAVVPVKSIEGVRVSIRNTNWKMKYAIIINKGDVNEIINNTAKVLKVLLNNNVNISKESVCASYCGVAIETDDDVNKLMNYKRK
jgi:hypothetical protein